MFTVVISRSEGYVRLRKSKCKVEHIVFLVRNFSTLFKLISVYKDDVAGRTGERSLASAFKFNTVLVSDFQKVHSYFFRDGLHFSIFEYPVDSSPTNTLTDNCQWSLYDVKITEKEVEL